MQKEKKNRKNPTEMGRYIIEHITNGSKTIRNQATHHNYTNYHNYPGVRSDAPCGFLLIIPLFMLFFYKQELLNLLS